MSIYTKPAPASSEALHAEFLAWRGVETPCPACRGCGVQVYGSTATWRGGLGGAAMTSDVCDACWGSGDAERPWTNLRRIDGHIQTQVAKRAVNALVSSVGRGMVSSSLRPALVELLDELEQLSKKTRKKRHPFFQRLATSLLRVLSEGAAYGPAAMPPKEY